MNLSRHVGNGKEICKLLKKEKMGKKEKKNIIKAVFSHEMLLKGRIFYIFLERAYFAFLALYKHTSPHSLRSFEIP